MVFLSDTPQRKHTVLVTICSLDSGLCHNEQDPTGSTGTVAGVTNMAASAQMKASASGRALLYPQLAGRRALRYPSGPGMPGTAKAKNFSTHCPGTSGGQQPR